MNKIVRDEELEEEGDDAVIGVALRYSALALTMLTIGVGILFAVKYLRRPDVAVVAPVPVSLPKLRAEAERPLPSLPMIDITQQAGITFIHQNGAAGEKLLPETMGGGCAFFDFDRDGDADILLTNSKPWSHAQLQATTSDLPTMALYRNDGTGKFEDVTAQVGLNAVLFGQGCAVGDYDNDGDADLFISAVSESASSPSAGSNNDAAGATIAEANTSTATSGAESTAPVGPNRLYRNDGGKFVDVTRTANVGGAANDWGTSCGWFDYDNDADLDLWVCNYVDWSREFDLAQNFRLTGGERAYGRPQAFAGSYPHLYRNDGDGRFNEVSQQANIRIDAATTGTPLAKSLGLSFFDFDRDGNLDVLVANDTVQNNLFRNMGDGSFREMATLAGIAFDAEGNARGAMGLDVGCARDDPRCACVAIGNFANEMTAFYVSAPDSLVFSDQAVANGIGPSTRLLLTFGVFFFDADLDGWDDLFHANGHLEEDIAKVQTSQTYEQSPQLFWNAGPEATTEYVALPPSSTGGDLAKPMVGRGATYADIDNDGDLDVLIAATGQRPRLLRNDQSLGHHWLRIHLRGNGLTSNRDAIGAMIDLKTKAGRLLHKIVNPTRSYLSQTELPVTVGLGNDEVESLEITWPDGKRQSVEVPQVDRTIEIIQSDAQEQPPANL